MCGVSARFGFGATSRHVTERLVRSESDPPEATLRLAFNLSGKESLDPPRRDRTSCPDSMARTGFTKRPSALE